MRVDPEPPSSPDPSAGYERSDMSIRVIVKFAIGFVIFVTVAHVIMIAMLFAFRSGLPAPVTPLSPPAVRLDAPVVGPRLEVDPSSSWEQMRDTQNRLLGLKPYRPEDAYGWISPEAGIVRIPIQRAMELALQRGFPVRTPATQSADARQAR